MKTKEKRNGEMFVLGFCIGIMFIGIIQMFI